MSILIESSVSGSDRAGHRRRQNPGIALLEVLLVVAIIAIGLGAVLRSFSTAARLQSTLESRGAGQTPAKDLMTRVRASRELQRPGEHTGTFDAPNEDFTWRVRVESAVGDTPFALVEVAIFEKEDDRNAYRFHTLLPAN